MLAMIDIELATFKLINRIYYFLTSISERELKTCMINQMHRSTWENWLLNHYKLTYWQKDNLEAHHRSHIECIPYKITPKVWQLTYTKYFYSRQSWIFTLCNVQKKMRKLFEIQGGKAKSLPPRHFFEYIHTV